MTAGYGPPVDSVRFWVRIGIATIYEFRPASCIDFPHTNRARFAASADFHSENAIYCPAVFYVIEQMEGAGDKVNRGTGRTTSAPCGPFA